MWPLHDPLLLCLLLLFCVKPCSTTCLSFVTSRQVDATALPPGLHYAEVQAHCSQSDRTRGPLFRIPVVVVKPLLTSAAPRVASLEAQDVAGTPYTSQARLHANLKCRIL